MFCVRTILENTGGILIQGDQSNAFTGVSIDSRTIKPGELFFALKGEKFDGHEFITEAVKRGGKGIVVQKEVTGILDKNFPIIKVPDTIQALGDIANFWRRRHQIPLVAITGSNGKTTTKEMLAGVLAEKYKVVKNPGNFNNLIGLPLSLLNMNSHDQIAVLEMGMNRKGEIRRLTQIAEPDIGILTNISAVHLEGLATLKGVTEAKRELLEVMGGKGRLIFNSDDHRVAKLGNGFPGEKISFGIRNPSDWVATNITKEAVGVLFKLKGPMGTISISLRLLGRHQVYNALAASAAASLLGLELEEIKRGLDAFKPLPMRMELLILGRDIKIINDTYNANPQSMRLALRTLKEARGGRKIAVLGDMWELGEQAPKAHIEIGRWVKEAGVKLLFLLGQFAPYVSQGALKAGMDPKTVFLGKDPRELIHLITPSLRMGDWVLIKGSRIMKMERIIEGLREKL
jgi:UDP-N-acetylmuramoyl-tripeptide--D-alanyl-D-alanine ligase